MRVEDFFKHTWSAFRAACKCKIFLSQLYKLLLEITPTVKYIDESINLKLATEVGQIAWPKFNKYGYIIRGKKYTYCGGINKITTPNMLSELGFDVEFLREVDSENGLQMNLDASILHPLDSIAFEKAQRIDSNDVPDLDVHGVFITGQTILKMHHIVTDRFCVNKQNNSQIKNNRKDLEHYVEHDKTRYLELCFGCGGGKHGTLKQCTKVCAIWDGFQYKEPGSNGVSWLGITRGPNPAFYHYQPEDINGNVVNSRFRINLNGLSLKAYHRQCAVAYYLATHVLPNVFQPLFIPAIWTDCFKFYAKLSEDDKNALELIVYWTDKDIGSLSGTNVCGAKNCGVKK